MDDTAFLLLVARVAVVFSGHMLLFIGIALGRSRVVDGLWLWSYLLVGPGDFYERFAAVRRAPRDEEGLERFVAECSGGVSDSEVAKIRRGASRWLWLIFAWIVAAILGTIGPLPGI